jgi:O-antigen ligase
MRVIALSIYPYLCFALFFTLPFDDYFRALPNILLIALAAMFPFVFDTAELKILCAAPGLGSWCFWDLS